MFIQDKPLEELTKEEIQEAMLLPDQPPVHTIKESIEELKAMGIRDINDIEDAEKNVIQEALKSIQFQKTLLDFSRNSTDKKSIKEYLENHVDFLVNISPGKTKYDIISHMTLDHAKTILKISAKMTDVPEKLIKKHLAELKKKYKNK